LAVTFFAQCLTVSRRDHLVADRRLDTTSNIWADELAHLLVSSRPRF